MKKVTIPCDCGCSVVTVVEFPTLNKDELGGHYAEFYTMVRPPFRERLSTAWKVFRGRDHWIHDVALNEEALRELRDYLNTIKWRCK